VAIEMIIGAFIDSESINAIIKLCIKMVLMLSTFIQACCC